MCAGIEGPFEQSQRPDTPGLSRQSTVHLLPGNSTVGGAEHTVEAGAGIDCCPVALANCIEHSHSAVGAQQLAKSGNFSPGCAAILGTQQQSTAAVGGIGDSTVAWIDGQRGDADVGAQVRCGVGPAEPGICAAVDSGRLRRVQHPGQQLIGCSQPYRQTQDWIVGRRSGLC